MKRLLRSTLVAAISIAVLVTFTPMVNVATADAATKAKAPANFSGTAKSSKKIVLKWSKVKNAKSFTVFKNGKKYKTVKALSFTDKKVKKGKVYKYAVKPAKGKKSYTIKVKATKNANVVKVKATLDANEFAISKAVGVATSVSPSKVYSKKVQLVTSNAAVAKISNGKVVGVAKGKCTITARSHNGISTKININVVDPAGAAYVNGLIYTVDGNNWDKKPQVAMAVGSNGKILKVGSKKAVDFYVTKATQYNDLAGKAVYPGFIDSHVHPPGTSITDLFEINNYYDFNIDKTMATIQAFVTANPDLEVYWGSGFNFGMFGEGTLDPRALLDGVSSDKPIILRSNDGHNMWLNSKALEECDITKDTEASEGGRIQHYTEGENAGEPNGILTDCSELVTIEKNYTKDQYMQAMEDFTGNMNAWGYTGCNTGGQSNLQEAIDLDKANNLTLRMNFSSNMSPDNTVKENMSNLEANIAATEDCKNVMVKTAKFFVDGVVEGSTAYLFEPYVGTVAGEMGEDWVSAPKWENKDYLNKVMLETAKKGIQIHVHAIGDAAIHMTIDGVEYAQEKAGNQDYRNVITHLQVMKNRDKERMGNLGMIGAVQPFWHLKEPDWYEPVDENVLGTKRAWKEYPLKTLQDEGVVLTSSGDYPVSPTNNPFWAIEAGCTRNLNNADYYGVEDITDIDDPTYLLNPAERVSLKTMIEAYTINGAYQMYEEDLCGSLSVGKVADFIILDEDPMQSDLLDLDSIVVLKTYKDGKCVYNESE